MKVSTVMTPDPVSVASEATLDDALRAMDAGNFRHLPVIDDGQLVGVVSDRDLLEATGWLQSRVHACRGTEAFEEVPKNVADIMRSPVDVIDDELELSVASDEMLERGIGCLPAVRNGSIVGILTDVDVLHAYLSGRATLPVPGAMEMAVIDCMTPDPTTIEVHETLGHALRTARGQGIRHLPVLEGGELVGMLSDRDLRRALGAGRPESTPISDIVTWQVVTTNTEDSLAEVALVMYERKLGALPVIKDDDLVGIISLVDVINACLGQGE